MNNNKTTEANVNFISVKSPELMSKWVGESEKRVSKNVIGYVKGS